MRNVLLEDVSRSEIARTLRETGTRPLIPPREDPCWRDEAVCFPVDRWLAEIRAQAVRHAGEPLPELTDDLYADFARTGRRRLFEEVYFERRRRLGDVAVTALFAPEGEELEQWLALLLPCAESILEEESWALPAHVKDPSGKDPLEIDLFAAETANLLAELLTVFGDDIPAPLERRIRERLRREIFANYLERGEEFPWTGATHNWNAVCHQGVVGAALAIEEDVELVAEIVRRAGRALRLFLGGFSDEGGCSEGPAYWNYGFGWFSVLNEQLETRTGGRLTLFEGDPRIREIARFPCRVSLAGGCVVNFSDSEPKADFRPSILQYLGERLDDDDLRDEARYRYAELGTESFPQGGIREDLFHHVRLFLYCPDDVPPEPEEPPREDFYFPRLGVLVARGHGRGDIPVEFAAKGGDNAEHHNHNDCGSFLYHAGGRRFAVEIGSPEYDRDYFGDLRYTCLAARSLGHSVPRINGCEQRAGQPYRAEVVEVDRAGDAVVFRLDLTRAYPPAAGCVRVLRTFRFDRTRGWLEVEDTCALTEAATWESALVTDASVAIDGDAVLLDRTECRVRVDPGSGTRLNAVESYAWRTHAGEPATVRRIVFVPESLESRTAVRFTLGLV